MKVILKRAIDPGEVTEQTRVADIGLDSLEIMEGVFTLEDELGIRIEMDAEGAFGRFETVDDIVRAVEAEVAKQA